MKHLVSRLIGAICLLGTVLAAASCGGTAPARVVREADSLNRAAYEARYRQLEVSRRAAEAAYEASGLYKWGKAEACNNLGFCAFMSMDFEAAERWHKQVYELTENELERLVADIGLMKTYQRTALNKEFYDYRNRALKRMKRIGEDNELFVDKRTKDRLRYARSEFFLVSAVYYHYLQQRAEALRCLREVSGFGLEADTNQLICYHYIKGASHLCEGETAEAERLQEFDHLMAARQLASRGGYVYFEGNAGLGLADLMAFEADFDFFRMNRPADLRRLSSPADTLLPMRLAGEALQAFGAYGGLYQAADAYVSIGYYLNAHGRYAEALDTLARALECVNQHHCSHYDCRDSADWLRPYDGRDAACVEKSWMKQKLKTVPEWISRIREQLCVAYSGLGMKPMSDYNRNVYLDILDDTRQDKELESRYQALEHEARQLNYILFFVLAGLPVVGFLCWLFNKRSEVRNRVHLRQMEQILGICRQIVASVPADAASEEEIVSAVGRQAEPSIRALLGVSSVHIEGRRLKLPARLGKDERAMAQVIDPYIQWALENGKAAVSLGEEHRRLESQRYIHECHIAENKRKNLVKRACYAVVAGIRPYIDRIANEVDKLLKGSFDADEQARQGKMLYIGELVDTINEYNEVLALWVKVRQGELSLNIENFELNNLFALLQKGSRAFELKHQRLDVEQTDACVKADRALTLFMLNTLADNARKYTPQGGLVRVYARKEVGYVEISVEDNGRGLSAGDVERIVAEKVYDSKLIGLSQATDEAERDMLLKNKGDGFGLMNCKGIIEKYKKAGETFRVCRFGVESEPGRGSRFYFRLPPGVRKALILLWLIPVLAACQLHTPPGQAGSVENPVQDAVPVWKQDGYEQLLDSASGYADAAYYCNVEGDFEWALAYIDSAIFCLNAHYERYASKPGRLMALYSEEEPAEFEWWDDLFYSDFHVILDIRNEAAVAFLALKQWKSYGYNNEAYTTLYKLLGEDKSLEGYCRKLEQSSTNKMVGIALSCLLLLVLPVGYYLLYFRRRMLNRWNLEQVFDINRQVFAASSVVAGGEAETGGSEDGNRLHDIPQRIVDESFEAVNDLFGINRLSIGVYNESSQTLEYASARSGEEMVTEDGQSLMEQCYLRQAYVSRGEQQAFPLVVEAAGESRCVGVLALERKPGTRRSADRLLLELVTKYVALVIFNSVVKLAGKYRDIETACDEARRASWEDSQLHVQNMVLDNCLSTIKHETLYYPNKIKQLAGKLRAGGLPESKKKETLAAIGELTAYYKGIFDILSQCASRQLEEIAFRRMAIPVETLLSDAGKYFRKAARGRSASVRFHAEASRDAVLGDRELLRFLFECLIDEALFATADGDLSLQAESDGDFVRFSFMDARRSKPQAELDRLFYPDLSRMAVDDKGTLHGVEFLLCKQIIREHDEYVGRRGCRMYAQAGNRGEGFTVCFTVPRSLMGAVP